MSCVSLLIIKLVIIEGVHGKIAYQAKTDLESDLASGFIITLLSHSFVVRFV